ncbi:MAG: TIGR03936 family radical SAM-associated protein [Candidatus Omnitrophota bacterium]
MVRVKFIFTKKGHMRFISHLDLMRLLMRAFRRSGLPLKMTEGFNPHPKLSMRRALKLGLESDHEEAAIVLREELGLKEFGERLSKQLPEGIHIKEVEKDA